jgi:peptidoglycan/LPS O-acetylase OafA/YrhL
MNDIGVARDSSELPTEPAPYFPYSDGLRALAIFTVFLEHLSIAGPVLFHHMGISAILDPFDGVSMLFVLSAFLLSGLFIKAYMSDTVGFPAIGAYGLARFLRIYPLYLVAILIIGGLELFNHDPITRWDLVSHLLFLQNASTETTQTISGPMWTMAVDVQFYFMLPILFAVLFSLTRRSDTAQRLRLLFYTLGVLCIASVAYRYFAVAHFRPTTLEGGIVYVRQLPGMLCVFTIGIAARAFTEIVRDNSRRTIASNAWPLIGLAIFLQPVSLFLHQARLHQILIGHFSLGAKLWAIEDVLSGSACALLLLTVSLSPNNAITRILSTRFFAFAAAISYAMYLFHLPVLQAVLRSEHKPSLSLFLRTGAISLAILVPVCFILNRAVEEPFLKLKSHLRRIAGRVVPDVSEMRHDRAQSDVS